MLTILCGDKNSKADGVLLSESQLVDSDRFVRCVSFSIRICERASIASAIGTCNNATTQHYNDTLNTI